MKTDTPHPALRVPNPRRAFTLIELLVVVTIICVLLAILLPSIGRAVDNARAAQCSSQQWQLMVAWLQFPSDNFGKMCGSDTGSSGTDWVMNAGGAAPEPPSVITNGS